MSAIKFKDPAAKRRATEIVLATLQRAQRHFDRLPTPDQDRLGIAQREAVEAVVDMFVENSDEADAVGLKAAHNFTSLLHDAALKRFSVVEGAALASLSDMKDAMAAAVLASSEARFSREVGKEAREKDAMTKFYAELSKYAMDYVKYHGAELILDIAKEDLRRLQGKVRKS